MLFYGLAAMWVNNPPGPGDSIREVAADVVLLLWCGLPYLLLLAAQLSFSGGLGARFMLFVTAMVSVGAGTLFYNQPPSNSRPLDFGVLGTLAFLIVTGGHLGVAVLGTRLAQWLSRRGRPDNNKMQLTSHG
jgi:hypothetical protein